MRVHGSAQVSGRPRRSIGRELHESVPSPESVGRWVGKDRLLALVVDAVSGADRSRLAVADREVGVQAPEPMLALVVYCYASGLHGSEAVEQVAHDQGTARGLGLSRCPSAEDIQRFRRRHRPLIKERLAMVIEMAWRMKSWLAQRDWERNSYVPEPLGPCGVRESAPSFAELADRWIERAVLFDSVARDI